VSTGSGQRYCVDGVCDIAVTPLGSFHVYRRKLGQDVSRLGVLYNPLYFTGGWAIHGEPYDPPFPASHGCVRIPMAASLWFYNEVPDGTPVYVLSGGNRPPTQVQATPGPPPVPTSTSVPVTTTSTLLVASTTTTIGH
jgi:hypothetical protein